MVNQIQNVKLQIKTLKEEAKMKKEQLRLQEKALDDNLKGLPEEDRKAHREILKLKKLFNEIQQTMPHTIAREKPIKKPEAEPVRAQATQAALIAKRNKGQQALHIKEVKEKQKQLKQRAEEAENSRVEHGRTVAKIYDQSEEVTFRLRKAREEFAFLNEELGDFQFMHMQEELGSDANEPADVYSNRVS